MLRQLLTTGLALAAFVLTGAAASAAVKTKAITYKDGDVELEGHLAWDDAVKGKRPGVLVVPEWWGLNDYARGRAEQLAKMGYVAFAVDMYGKGKLTNDPAQAREWATALRSDTDAWRKRARAGLDVLKKQDDVDTDRLAAIGYCFGGSTCLQLAYAGEDLKAVGTFHAALPTPTPEEAERINPRILVCHGAADAFIPEPAIAAFRAALDGAKVKYKFVAYPDVRHSFTVPNADSHKIEMMKYDKAADEASWKELEALFKETLAAPAAKDKDKDKATEGASKGGDETLSANETAAAGNAPLAAADSLAAKIDQLIAAKAGGPVAARSGDAEFVRRAYLDFAGRIPSGAEARAFLADAAADKRAKLVARLLDGPEYALRMSQTFHVMLMERLGDDAGWEAYLRTSFAANKPWDQLAREVLNPNPDEEATRSAGHFLSKRLENYGQNAIDFPGLTRDVGRLFLGVDLQYAQCHDHPQVDDYKQYDFQGLFVVYSNLSRSNGKFPGVAEKPLSKKIEFQSVFTMAKGATGPRLPFGMEFELASFKPGEEFAVPPDKKTNAPGKLKFSPLQVISENLTKPENPYFTKNAVNRLWFVLMGRGLNHPLDLSHAKNPPSHPEVLDLLAKEFAEHKFDVKWLLQELAATETYQRLGVPAGVTYPDPAKFVAAIERPLAAEQFLRSVLEATGDRERVEPPVAAGRGAKAPMPSVEPALPKYDDLAKKFTVAFGNAPRDPEVEFAPTLKGALFLMNSDTLLSLLRKRPGNLIERCLPLAGDPNRLADELYLAILSRSPDEGEKAEVAAFVAKHAADPEKAVGQLAWALLASTEFATNH